MCWQRAVPGASPSSHKASAWLQPVLELGEVVPCADTNLSRLWTALLDQVAVGKVGNELVGWEQRSDVVRYQRCRFPCPAHPWFFAVGGKLVPKWWHSSNFPSPGGRCCLGSCWQPGKHLEQLLRCRVIVLKGQRGFDGTAKPELVADKRKVKMQFFTEECLLSRCLLFLTHKSWQLWCQADKMFTQL